MSQETCKTVRVQPWSKDQGAFVEINESDFNEKIHKLYEGKTPDGVPPKANPVNPVVNDGLNFASKAARDKAIESGLDFSKVKGTGTDKKITAADVDAHIEASKPGVNFASDEAGEIAADLGLSTEELLTIEGTGTDGAITVEDVQKFADEKGE